MMLIHLTEGKSVDVKCVYDIWTHEKCRIRPYIEGGAIFIHRMDEFKFNVSQEEEPLNTVKDVAICDNTSLIEISTQGPNIELTVVPMQLFEIFPDIRHLDARCRTLRELLQTDFTYARKLEVLQMVYSGLTELKAHTFKFARNLKDIIFLYSQIEKIEDYAFDGIKDLKNIILRSNHLKHIGKYRFAGLLSLDTLDLSQNQLKEIDVYAFNLPKLTNLQLDSNELLMLPDGLFAQVPALIELHLVFNKLELVRNALYSLNNLQLLDIRVKQITDFNLKKVAKLPNLTELDLSASGFDLNAFSVTLADINKSNSKLKTLKLTSSEITSPNIFAKLKLFPNLETVDLGSNPFKEMDVETIRDGGLPKLREIGIRYNQLDKQWLESMAAKLALEFIPFYSGVLPGSGWEVGGLKISNKLQFVADFETEIRLN